MSNDELKDKLSQHRAPLTRCSRLEFQWLKAAPLQFI